LNCCYPASQDLDYCTLCIEAQLIPHSEHSVFLLERPINNEWGNNNFIVRNKWDI